MDASTSITNSDLHIVSEDAPVELKFGKRQLQGLLRFASSDAARVNLHQVWFQNGCAVATDGHRLAAMGPSETLQSQRLDKVAGFGINRGALDRVAKIMRSGDELTIAATGSCLRKKAGDEVDVSTMLPHVSEDTLFPPFQHVIPRSLLNDTGSRSSAVRGFNAKYLADLAVLPDLAGYGNESSAVRFIMSNGELDPSLVTSECPDTGLLAICVLMPVRL